MATDDKRLERIENKIDSISDKLETTNVTLGAQHVSLSEHMRRTALLESAIKPIIRKVTLIEGAFKAIGIVAALLAIFEAVKAIFS